MNRLEARLALARDWDELPGNPMPGGRTALWVRIPELTETSMVALAIFGDYVPFGIGQSLGAYAGGNSLDNTLRVIQVVPTDWVLLDVRIQAVHHGFGHGDVYQWSSDGTLMGIASQSAIVREVSEPTPGRLPPWMTREIEAASDRAPTGTSE